MQSTMQKIVFGVLLQVLGSQGLALEGELKQKNDQRKVIWIQGLKLFTHQKLLAYHMSLVAFMFKAGRGRASPIKHTHTQTQEFALIGCQRI